MKNLKLREKFIGKLVCPICKNNLRQEPDEFICQNEQCEMHFPLVDKIPVFINENNSVFSIEIFLKRGNTCFKTENKLTKFLKKILPSFGKNLVAKDNFKKIKKILKKMIEPKVLIIGGSIIGQGLEEILFDNMIDFVESDVSFGERTTIIFDSHDIPFADKTFDGVIIQAVLEHVADPYRCVEEIYRVLKDDGIVYAETPFMQQVHSGKYDFTRFTYLGHRRLFRKFEDLDSGVACGPAMALIWAYSEFLLSFSESKLFRKFITAFAQITGFWLKYFDYYLIKKHGSYDSASGYYFIGKKSDKIISDKELLNFYKGCK